MASGDQQCCVGSKQNGVDDVGSCNSDEKKYLDQIRYIIENGDKIGDRTGVGTVSVFGMHTTYSLRDSKYFFSNKKHHIFDNSIFFLKIEIYFNDDNLLS